MKLTAVVLALMPDTAIALSWASQELPTFEAEGTSKFVGHATLTKGARPLILNFDQQCWQPADAIKLNQILSLKPCEGAPPQWRLFKDGDYVLEMDTRSGTPTLMLSVKSAIDPVTTQIHQYPKWDSSPLTLDVSRTFPEGAVVRNFYNQQTAMIKNGSVALQPAATSNGLLLLEWTKTDAPAALDWYDATMCFVLTDRFVNGDPNNDHSYGRRNDDMQEIGAFHGGDLRGLTGKLDHLQWLSINALQISALFERVHGWVGSSTRGDSPHYACHDYYTQDQTTLDANMGNEANLRTLADDAHQRDIRILLDVIMNHTGYTTLTDMQEYHFGALYLSDDELKDTLGKRWTGWKPAAGQSWCSFNDYVDFSDKTSWEKWWGRNWIRTDIDNYNNPGFDDLTMSLAFLPDLKTGSTTPSGLPSFYLRKPDTHTKAIAGYTPRDYLIHWLNQWVRDCGIDGFRVDTAKHVELPAWQQLRTQASVALIEWRKANPDKALDGKPFWMTSEAWGHGMIQSDYYHRGFDAMINFDYQGQVTKAADYLADMNVAWQQMTERLQDFNVLSYLSSRDTRLFREDGDKAAELLLLAPDTVQLFYGDESARPFGPTGSGLLQGMRSEINWPGVAGESATSVTR